MKTKFFVILSIMLLSLFVLSCEDSTGPNIISLKMSDYFPTNEGSWWIFNSYETDDFGEWHFKDRDFVYMEPDTIIEGKTAYPRIHFSRTSDVINLGITYFALENSKLYVYDNFEEKWTIQIDLAKTEIILDFKEEHSDSTHYDEITGDSIRYKFDGIYYHKSKREADTIYTFKGNKIPTIEVGFNSFSETTSRVGDINKTKTIDATTHQSFGKNVGIINILSYGFAGKRENYKSELVDYYIKK